eukprot:9602108-Heterocapsa_arctica.AAC.1
MARQVVQKGSTSLISVVPWYTAKGRSRARLTSLEVCVGGGNRSRVCNRVHPAYVMPQTFQ